jgi:hypothetical protein
MDPKEPKSVTSEGISGEQDLGHVEPPSLDTINSLDRAMDEAGIGDATFAAETTPPAETPPKEETPPAETPPAETAPVVVTPPAETIPVETTPPAEPKSEIENIDLDAITPPPGVSPKNLVNFNKLREVAKHYKEQAARIPELEQRATAAPIPEELTKELTELRTFRKIFDTENDPEFQHHFTSQFEKLDEDIYALLKRNGLSEATEADMRKLGLDKIDPRWWQDNILERLSFVDQERIRKRLAERADLSDSRAKILEDFQTHRGEYVKRIEESRQAQAAQSNQEVLKHLDHLTANVPWARYREVPATATAKDKVEIEEHNKGVKELETRFHEALNPQSPQARAEVAAAAVASIKLADSVRDLGSRLAAANERAEKAEKALEAVRVAGTPPSSRQSPRKTSAEQQVGTGKMSDEDAIEAGLQTAESAL